MMMALCEHLETQLSAFIDQMVRPLNSISHSSGRESEAKSVCVHRGQQEVIPGFSTHSVSDLPWWTG